MLVGVDEMKIHVDKLTWQFLRAKRCVRNHRFGDGNNGCRRCQGYGNSHRSVTWLTFILGRNNKDCVKLFLTYWLEQSLSKFLFRFDIIINILITKRYHITPHLIVGEGRVQYFNDI